jgi:hypothetical protein
MLNTLKLFLVKAIDKYYIKKRVVKITGNGNTRNALVSYVMAPKYYLGFYFRSSHNNRLQAYLIGRYLKAKGYNVYMYSYLDENVDYAKEYDIFIGHNITFANIAKKLNGHTKKVLLVTGSAPEFGNSQQKQRIEDVNKRHGVNFLVYGDNIVPDLSKNYEMADNILILGNDFVKETYPINIQSKIKLLDNTTQHPFFNVKTTNTRNNNFLFISSVGQIHRGLDLLLEVFPGKTSKLYILSNFNEEQAFVELYRKEIYDTPNIIPVGYLALNSKKFQKIISDIDFVILPSCSEGQSSSVINIMAYGKIPVIPDNVGVPDVSTIGIKINELTVEGVDRSVKEAISLSDAAFNQKKQNLSIHNKKYLSKSFVSRLKAIGI